MTSCSRLGYHVKADALQTPRQPFGDPLGVALIKIASTEFFIRCTVANDMIGSHQNLVGDRDGCFFVSVRPTQSA